MQDQVEWFKGRGWYNTNENEGEVGDVVFMGKLDENGDLVQGSRHNMIISDIKEKNGQRLYRVVTARNSKNVSTQFKTYNTISKYETWYPGKAFRGFGQIKKNKQGEKNLGQIWESWKQIGRSLLKLGKSLKERIKSITRNSTKNEETE